MKKMLGFVLGLIIRFLEFVSKTEFRIFCLLFTVAVIFTAIQWERENWPYPFHSIRHVVYKGTCTVDGDSYLVKISKRTNRKTYVQIVSKSLPDCLDIVRGEFSESTKRINYIFLMEKDGYGKSFYWKSSSWQDQRLFNLERRLALCLKSVEKPENICFVSERSFTEGYSKYGSESEFLSFP